MCAMLKRAQRLAEEKKRAAAQAPTAKRVTSRDFSLRESPLTRALAFNVGSGSSAAGMQKISAAAMAESGKGNVHRSSSVVSDKQPNLNWLFVYGYELGNLGTAWASAMGSSGRSTQHCEEMIHRAAGAASGDVSFLKLDGMPLHIYEPSSVMWNKSNPRLH